MTSASNNSLLQLQTKSYGGISHCVVWDKSLLIDCKLLDLNIEREFIRANGVDALTCSSGYDIGVTGCEGMFKGKAGDLFVFTYYKYIYTKVSLNYILL